MKTITTIFTRLISVFTANENKNELMPQLIPVRVITNRIPRKENP